MLGLLGILSHKFTEKEEENEMGMEVGREIASLYIHMRGHTASKRGRQEEKEGGRHRESTLDSILLVPNSCHRRFNFPRIPEALWISK